MSVRKLVGLAAIGGFLYANKRRGGQLNLASFKETARCLVDDVKARAQDMKAQAEEKLNEARDAADNATQSNRVGENPTGYGSAGYGYSSNDINRR
jgi:hypothetical protein